MKWTFSGETSKYDKDMKCANCGTEIEKGGEYWKCSDIYLSGKYFDNEKCNVFCSEGCFCRALFLESFYNGHVWDDE